ncbi:hypothetical protein SEVIR_3G285801v4 [Setaria viridis]
MCSMVGGEVRYGPHGVDLSEFQSFCKQLPRARERTWASICNWLFKAFNLDRDQVELSVRAVVSLRCDIIFWELMLLEGTQNWRTYVNGCTKRGLLLILFVEVFRKIGCSN